MVFIPKMLQNSHPFAADVFRGDSIQNYRGHELPGAM